MTCTERLSTPLYRKFSQSSTNALQAQITAVQDRHAATVSTLQLQLSQAESQLASERTQCIRLQDALDELCEDLARETYGRRREVALRLALLAREEAITESLGRWVRRARESYTRFYSLDTQDGSHESVTSAAAGVQDAFHRIVSDAESLLSTLNDELEFSDGSVSSAAQARIAVAREAVEALRNELQDEMRKRIEAVRRFGTTLDVHTPDNLLENGVQSENLPITPLPNGDTLDVTPSKEGNVPSQDVCSPLMGISKQATGDDPFQAGCTLVSFCSRHSC